MSNRLLAEVESGGEHVHTWNDTCVLNSSLTPKGHWYIQCDTCGERKLVNGSNRKSFDPSDYPNDLEACMRVAEKLSLDVRFVVNGGYDIVVRWGSGNKNMSVCPIIGSRAATLYPMLVEIAERRKE